jgi:hypothetical protein
VSSILQNIPLYQHHSSTGSIVREESPKARLARLRRVMKESGCIFRALSGLLLVHLILGQQPPGDTDLCLVCLDGSTPLETDDLLDEGRFGPGISCASLLEGAEDLLGECNEDFFVLQLTLIQANCCPNGSRSPCTLCPDASSDIAFPSRSVPTPTGNLVDISCSDLIDNETVKTEFLADFVGEPGVCENTLVRRSAGYCGCPSIVSTQACDLCNGGELIPDGEFSLIDTPCSEIAFEVSLLPPDQCQQASNGLLGFDAAALCCENVDRPNQCNLCSAREQLVPVRAVTTEAYGQVTCAELQDAATLTTTSSACQSLQNEAGGACCIPRPASDICELTCPDGSTPPDPLKRDPVTGYSCQDLALEFAKYSADECDKDVISSAIGFDAEAFCCPRVNPPDQCVICPQGEELIYPERVLFAYEGHSCSALSESLRHTLDFASCQSVVDDSRAERNCQCRTSPVSPPTQAPTPDGGGSGTTIRSPGQYLVPATLLAQFYLFWML